MSGLVLAFIVLNAFLLGLGIAGVIFVRSAVKEMEDIREETEQVKGECVTLTKTISEAHNGMAHKLLEIQDKLKAIELRAAQSQVGRKP